jgi:hypothetical protein
LLCQLDVPLVISVVENRIPADAQILHTTFDAEHAAVVVTLASGEWEPTGGTVPILAAPVFGRESCDVLPLDDEPATGNLGPRHPQRIALELGVELPEE